MTEHTDILVVGAGISGLTAAWNLHKAGRDVQVLEASSSVGGAMQSARRDGYVLEKGPFNVIVRDPAFEQILDDFAGEVEVVAASRESGRRRFLLKGDDLVEVPSNPLKLLTSPLLSPAARLRLMRGLFFSRTGRAEDTIDNAAARRLGPKFAETLVSAMVSGIVAGDSRTLHLRSAFPSLSDIDRRAVSPLFHMLRRALAGGPRHKRKWRGLISFDRGLGALPEAIARRLGDRLATGARVTSIDSTATGYIVHYKLDGETRSIACWRVIIATPFAVAADLLEPLHEEAADIVRTIDAASLVVLNFGLDEAKVAHPLAGYGFLVPRTETEFPLLGVLFADSVFPHHAPPGRRLVRVFMGGARDPGAIDLSDDDLVALARARLEPLLGLKSDPVLVDINRYRRAIPQYELDHDVKIARLREMVATFPGLHLAGNYLQGVSINDCIRNGAQVAEEILTATVARDHAAFEEGEPATLEAVS